MKVPAKPGRPGTVLLAALLPAALLMGAPASAAPATAAGNASGHPGPSAEAVALLFHPGILGRLPGRGPRTPALPRPGANVPAPGNASALEAVTCTTSTNCWAVGTYRPATGQFDLNEALHWNGSAWAQVFVPSPGGTATESFSELVGVRCTAASNCWAVGVSQQPGGADLNEALHWNGAKWSVAPTPTPGGTIGGDVNELFDVACVSASNCWAAGRYGTQNGGTVLINEVLHWNGTRWSLAAVPNPGGISHGNVNALNSIRCTSAASCLAVGTFGTLGTPTTLLNEALRWNGKRWSQVAAPSPGGTTGDGIMNELNGLACSSGSNCWAVGDYGTLDAAETSLNQALHWNGTAWSVVATPEPDGTASSARQELAGAYCGSATDCWAVGSYAAGIGGTGATLNQALRWDGGTWSLVTTPDPAGTSASAANVLSGVRCTASASCWAVGLATAASGQTLNQVLRWNGTRWSAG